MHPMSSNTARSPYGPEHGRMGIFHWTMDMSSNTARSPYGPEHGRMGIFHWTMDSDTQFYMGIQEN
jgi:hypothetical protein